MRHRRAGRILALLAPRFVRLFEQRGALHARGLAAVRAEDVQPDVGGDAGQPAPQPFVVGRRRILAVEPQEDLLRGVLGGFVGAEQPSQQPVHAPVVAQEGRFEAHRARCVPPRQAAREDIAA